MNKKVVAVLFGGNSPEHFISKKSAYTIISNLSKEKYTIIPIYITKSGEWKIYDAPIENILNTTENWEKYSATTIISPDASHKGLLRIMGDKIKIINIDVVIPALHGKMGEDGTVQGLLELAQIPYVGCGVLSSSISMDKAFTKIVVNELNIKQAKYFIYLNNKNYLDILPEIISDIKKLEYPIFIKPANSGSSKGISKIENESEIEEGIKIALIYDNKIIVEQGIKGREIECSVIGNTKVKASKIGEIISNNNFYDYDNKYVNDTTKTIIPKDIDDDITLQIQKNAINIFKKLDGKGLARIDFFLTENNDIIFNEINTFPGFTDISMFPKLWQEAGFTITSLLDELIELAFEEFNDKK